MCKLQDWCRQIEYCRVLLRKHFSPERWWSWSDIDRILDALEKTSISIELHSQIFEALHCTGWINCSQFKQFSSRMDNPFRMSIFRLYPAIKVSFEHKSCRRNLFSSAFPYWDARTSLQRVDQNFKSGGTIGYWDQYLEFLFRHFKVFRLHPLLRDAPGTVRAQCGKCPGYCYMDGRGRNSCVLGHVAGLVFCLYVKLLLHSISNSVNFWNTMPCKVLDIELAVINVIKNLGIFIDGKFQGD